MCFGVSERFSSPCSFRAQSRNARLTAPCLDFARHERSWVLKGLAIPVGRLSGPRVILKGSHHGIESRPARIQSQPREIQPGDRSQEAPVVYAWRADCVPFLKLRAAAGCRSDRAIDAVCADQWRHPRHLQHLLGWFVVAHEPHRARRHALYHRVDRGAVGRLPLAATRGDQEGR